MDGEWGAVTTWDAVCRRAGGRRKYNSARKAHKQWRRAQILARIAGQRQDTWGLQAALAEALGVPRSTVSRRLAALRSLVKLARTLGMVPWALDVDGVRAEGYRDTRGPGRDGFRNLLALLRARADAKGARDRAVLRLLYDLGLRRAEVC